VEWKIRHKEGINENVAKSRLSDSPKIINKVDNCVIDYIEKP
jgi:hypothetical protein